MDTSDFNIKFDENGVCSNCRDYERALGEYGIPPQERQRQLDELVTEIKTRGRNSEYDCIIGVSGGVDSTYVAYLVKELGLRPLAVHMDNGWDSELSVSNIEKALKKLDIDLLTKVLDWEEFKDLQLSFLKASVVDPEVPTDHAIRATLVREAAKRGIAYVISGANIATEQILPKSWSYGREDWRFIKALQKRFGRVKLKDFPRLGYWDMFYFFVLRRIRETTILDYVDFQKHKALRVLEEKLDWRPYGGKHYESVYTRFNQGYIVYKKYGIDKRRAHLSTLVMSGQASRQEALEEMKKPPYSGYMLEEDMEYVLKKFGLSEEGFEELMSQPLKLHHEYPNNLELRKFIKSLNIHKFGQKIGIFPERI